MRSSVIQLGYRASHSQDKQSLFQCLEPHYTRVPLEINLHVMSFHSVDAPLGWYWHCTAVACAAHLCFADTGHMLGIGVKKWRMTSSITTCEERALWRASLTVRTTFRESSTSRTYQPCTPQLHHSDHRARSSFSTIKMPPVTAIPGQQHGPSTFDKSTLC